jgi:sugar lactone lactonase YvrE
LCAVASLLLASLSVGLSGTRAEAAAVGRTVAGGNEYGAAANQLANPEGVAVDASGNIYVGDMFNHRVQRWAPDATEGVTVAGGNGDGFAANQLSYPRGVVVDAQHNVYVASAGTTAAPGDRVQRWAPGATEGVTVAGGNGAGGGADQLRFPSDLALDNSGNLYIADSGNNRVQRWAPGATAGVTVAVAPYIGGTSSPILGVAVDAQHNVYVSEYFRNRVQRWAPGASEGVTVAGGNGAGSAPNQLFQPAGLAVDTAGNLFVADPVNERVQMWVSGATSGVTVAGGNGYGLADDQLNGPWEVAAEETAGIYIADTHNSRVQLWPTPALTMKPGAVAAPEGDEGTTTVGVPISLSRATAETVTVRWNTLVVGGAPAGQADPTSDYVPASGTITFAPGEVTQTASIVVRGDTVIEPSEYIVVSFHDPTNAPLTGVWGLGFATITADDSVLRPDFWDTREDNSGTTVLDVPILLSSPSSVPVTVQWNTLFVPGARPGGWAVGTVQADPGIDYVPASGTLTFPPGETQLSASITVNGDTVMEPTEFVIVSFHDPTNAVVEGFGGLGFGFIYDDD